MSESLYIRPIALAESPQSEEGEAVRLAGGLVYASRFALIVRRGGEIVSRQRVFAPDMPAALAGLPGALVDEGQAQWAALQQAHAPRQCGSRTIPRLGSNVSSGACRSAWRRINSVIAMHAARC